VYSGKRGPKKQVGTIALTIGYGAEGFRVIGMMRLQRGGQDGRRRLKAACEMRIKLRTVHLTEDQPHRYPKWPPRVVWFDRKLDLNTTVGELRKEMGQRAKSFFKVTKSFLT
jgi:hypothetical protein